MIGEPDIIPCNLRKAITDPENVKDAVSKITKKMKIDILVNSAGITGSTTELWNYDYEEWKTIVDIIYTALLTAVGL